MLSTNKMAKKEIIFVWLPIIIASTISFYLIFSELKEEKTTTKIFNQYTLSKVESINTEKNSWNLKNRRKEKLKLKITGILELNGKRVAIINGKPIKEGEKIGNKFKITKILANSIIIETENEKQKIRIGIGDEIELS